MKTNSEIESDKSPCSHTQGCFGYGFAIFQDPSWTLEQLLVGCKGTLLSGNVHNCFRSISTDSRSVNPGDVFVALNGEKFKGASFIYSAINAGAACVVTSQVPETELPVPTVLVKDTTVALGDLAAFRRTLVAKFPVLAITGSSGKTTVKEMTSSILSQIGNVLKTRGNFNNLIGLPLSLLPIDYRHNYAVLEMGMNKAGEIARLADIAAPDVACVLNVHGAHLEGLGSIEGVAKAKGELFDRCKSSAILVVNVDDKRVVALAAKKSCEKITFGMQKKAFVRATKICNKGETGMVFNLHIGKEKGKVRLKAFGRHNVINSLAAAAMAQAVGVNIKDIIKGLEEFKAGDKRLVVEDLVNGLKVVNDSYNANPASMQAALETVNGLKRGVKAVAILGDMLELGEFSETAHRELGAAVVEQGFDYFLAVGDNAATMVSAARYAGMDKERALSFDNKKHLAEYLTELIAKKHLSAGDYLLIKGSRGMAMETIIE